MRRGDEGRKGGETGGRREGGGGWRRGGVKQEGDERGEAGR